MGPAGRGFEQLRKQKKPFTIVLYKRAPENRMVVPRLTGREMRFAIVMG